MPAEHETWVEYDIRLPTDVLNPAGDLSGQRFMRHIAADAMWKASEFEGYEARDTGISTATGGLANVCVLRSVIGAELNVKPAEGWESSFLFILNGDMTLRSDGETAKVFKPGDSLLVANDAKYVTRSGGESELLLVRI
jgi:mannose-6-phosphate isomerase-like protein (cupin superfamily)